MNNLTMPTQEEGWLSKKKNSSVTEDTPISPDDYMIEVKTLKDSVMGVCLDAVSLHEKSKSKEMHDVLIHLEAAYKSLNLII